MVSDPHQSVFDVDTQRVAAVYAKAFVDAAEAQQSLDAWCVELDQLVDEVLSAIPDLERVLGSAFIPHDEKEALLDRSLGRQASPHLLSFLKVLSKRGRLDCLRAIRHEVGELRRDRLNRVAVGITTAAPVDASMRVELTASLKSLLGSEPEVEWAVEDSLLAGVVVRVGDTVYDSSVATRLRHLYREMVGRTVEAIETSRERFE